MQSTRSRHPNLVKGLLFGSGFLGYITALVMPLFVRSMAHDVGVEVPLVGWLAGAQGVLVGLASLIVGPISDVYGRKRVLLWSLVANAVAAAAFGRAWNAWSLYTFGALNALTFSPLAFCSLAYIADYFEPKERGAAVGVVTASVWAGVIIGTPLTVVMLELPGYGWRSVFGVIGALSALLFIATAFGLDDKRAETQGTQRRTTRGMLGSYAGFARDDRLRGFLSIFVLVRAGVGMYFVYGATYLLTSREFPAQGFIKIYPFGGLLAFGTSMLAGKLTDRIGAKGLVISSSVALIISIFLFLSYPTTPTNIVPAMAAFCALYMVSDAVRTAALQTEAVSKVSDHVRGAFMGLVSFLMYVSYGLGAIAGGFLLSLAPTTGDHARDFAMGYSVIVYTTAGLWVASIIFASRYVEHAPQRLAAAVLGAGLPSAQTISERK